MAEQLTTHVKLTTIMNLLLDHQVIKEEHSVTTQSITLYNYVTAVSISGCAVHYSDKS